jgi:gluconate 2-dehydrogenase gamma chain
MPQDLSRRRLLKYGGSLWGVAALSSQLPLIASAASSNRAEATFSSLSPAQAATVEAITARIIPTTDTPGAREAGAVWFIDAALAGDMRDATAPLVAGVAELDKAAGDTPFHQLPGDRQDALLREREDSDFFGLMHFLTVAGTFTMSEYGGNRDNAGWQILGLTDQHHWEPPFGYYDRDSHGERGA